MPARSVFAAAAANSSPARIDGAYERPSKPATAGPSNRRLPLGVAHGWRLSDPVDMATNGPTGRHRAPEETRSRVVDAAAAEFAARGYAATSVKQICRAAGVSVGSFYHHFDDKAVVVCELLEGRAEGFAAVIAAVDVGRPQTIESAVLELVEGEDAAVYRSLREAVEVEPRIADAAAQARRLVHDRLTATVRSARVHAEVEYAVDAPSLAWTMLSLVRDALSGRGGPPPRAIATVISHGAAALTTTGR
jgi:AcrR family transcriptional regulator